MPMPQVLKAVGKSNEWKKNSTPLQLSNVGAICQEKKSKQND